MMEKAICGRYCLGLCYLANREKRHRENDPGDHRRRTDVYCLADPAGRLILSVRVSVRRYVQEEQKTHQRQGKASILVILGFGRYVRCRISTPENSKKLQDPRALKAPFYYHGRM